MVRIPGLQAPEVSLSFVNPDATNHPLSVSRSEVVREHLLHPLHRHHDVTTLASPEDISEINESTIVYSGGGDGTVRRVIGAIIGSVPDDFEATRFNELIHRTAAENIILFAGADGNACNFGYSAHGRFAANPALLPYARSIWVGQHRPLMREILASDGSVVSSDIATSGIGLGGAAGAAGDLQDAKSELNRLKTIPRKIRETAISLNALLHAPVFSLGVDVHHDGETRSFELHDKKGLEFIGSETYAKLAHARVNIDDTYWQPIVQHRLPNPAADTALFAESLARLSFGAHIIKPIDFAEISLSLRVLSDKPVQFHEDGETTDATVLEPGQTMRLHLAKTAVQVLMVR